LTISSIEMPCAARIASVAPRAGEQLKRAAGGCGRNALAPRRGPTGDIISNCLREHEARVELWKQRSAARQAGAGLTLGLMTPSRLRDPDKE
jgi:hypothetical protein